MEVLLDYSRSPASFEVRSVFGVQPVDQGLGEVGAIADALKRFQEGDSAAAKDVAQYLLSYAKFLGNHIDKEDSVLFHFADQILTDSDQEELTKAFNEIEASEIGEGLHEEYRRFAYELMKH